MKMVFDHEGSVVTIIQEPSGDWRVWAKKCDNTFDVGSVLEPMSDNPMLVLNGGFGLNLIDRIIGQINYYKLSKKIWVTNN